ncbi:S8 family peptidase [Phreatobacter sp.]|uniref:S8 family peptidase n=1 Tax=Phreatobacter sp. TaxID=1966341 RepID=UPI003F6EF932
MDAARTDRDHIDRVETDRAEADRTEMTLAMPRLPVAARVRKGALAAFLALLAGSTFLVADVRPAEAQFGIGIGGISIGGGGRDVFRGRGRGMDIQNRMRGVERLQGLRSQGGRFGRFGGEGGRMGRFGGEGGRMGRFGGEGGRMGRFGGEGGRMGRFGGEGGRMGRFGGEGGRMGRFGGEGGRTGRFGGEGSRTGRFGGEGGRVGRGTGGEGGRVGRGPGGRYGGDRVPGSGRPGTTGKPTDGGVATRPPTRPPGRPPGGRPGGRPGWPDRGPVVELPPRGPNFPPGGRPPGGFPPGGGGGGLPPGLPPGPGIAPGVIAGAAAGALAIPALVSIARSSQARAQDAPGLPPANERRFVPDEVLFIMRSDASPAAVRNVVRRFNLTLISQDRSDLVGTMVHRYRVPNRLTVPAAIRAMQRAAGIAYVQPNYVFERPSYVFRLQSATTTQGGGASLQYVVDTLRLPEAHLIARGESVPIAVIDSGVDASHPEVNGRVVQSFDAVGGTFQPHEHGTGMVGAIVAQNQLTGVSPRANILAARAFAPGQTAGATGTSYHILRAMDWSIRQGARVINMSFAGPRDPMMTRAIQVAAGRRIALIAAMGNEGPDAPVSFPAADPNVIAVTATDRDGRLFSAASRGNHVAVAAPGVEVLLPAPRGGYQISSGTSVAAAHVSGIAALIIERQPDIDPTALRQILQETARRGTGPDPHLGAGVADPVPALQATNRPDQPGVPMVTAPPAPVPETARAPAAGPDTAQVPAGAAPRPASVDPAPATARP